jgi:hypothetical protein
METVLSTLRVVHIITAILLAWPFYALVAVNQRARLGPPLGDRVDTFLENTIKNRSIPCLVFQATALVSGLLILLLRGFGLDYLALNPILAAKLGLLFLIAGLLVYAMLVIQPKLDSLFATLSSPSAPPDVPGKIGALRLRRKRMASVCLFGVLASAMLGLQVWVPFPGYISLIFLLAITAFVWRAYSSRTPYGWV